MLSDRLAQPASGPQAVYHACWGRESDEPLAQALQAGVPAQVRPWQVRRPLAA
jgi:hypothetical protein